jgi:hypothetical protein
VFRRLPLPRRRGLVVKRVEGLVSAHRRSRFSANGYHLRGPLRLTAWYSVRYSESTARSMNRSCSAN